MPKMPGNFRLKRANGVIDGGNSSNGSIGAASDLTE